MAKDGIQYTGFLYAGVMIDAVGNPKTLEFNCRFGDPETQPIMMRLKSDLVDLVEHGINGTLDTVDAEWDRRVALGVVMAAHGYPENPRKGDAIHGLGTHMRMRTCFTQAQRCRTAVSSYPADVSCALPRSAIP